MPNNQIDYDGSPSPKSRYDTAILSRNTNEASLKPPNDWGRKSRKSAKDWMRQIIPSDSDDSGNYVDLLADPPANKGYNSPVNTYATVGKNKLWDADLDFTAQSLQISTSPQLRIRNTKLLEIRDEEISILETEDEEEEAQDDQEEPDQAQELPPLNGIFQDHGWKIQHHESERPDLRENIEPQRSKLSPLPLIVQNERMTVNNDKHNVRGQLHRADVRREQERKSRLDDSSQLRQRALERIRNEHKLKNEQRAKARAMEREEVEDFHEKTILEEEGERIPGTPITIFGRDSDKYSEEPKKSHDSFEALRNLSKAISNSMSGNVTPPKSDQDPDPEERIAAEASLFELQDNKSEKGSLRVPTPPPVDIMLMPTPKVTGAFIETPAPPRMRHNATKKEEEGQFIKREEPGFEISTVARRPERPVPINSAPKASALQDLLTIEKEAQFDDSTLGTFDAILEAEAELIPDTTLNEPIVDLEFDGQGRPLSDAEKERRIDVLTLQRLNRKLRHTSNSIRDTRHGIEDLEQRVSSQSQKAYTTPIEMDSNQPINDTSVYYLKIPIPRFRRNNKFTWFGLLFLIFFGWYIAESMMCAQFCHPQNSMYDTWSPEDPFFPWAIPTKLDQWTGKFASGAWDDVYERYERWRGPRKRVYRSGPLGGPDWFHYLKDQKDWDRGNGGKSFVNVVGDEDEDEDEPEGFKFDEII